MLVVQGALNALLSPKAVFFYLVLFPQFLQPENGNVLFQSLVLITIINAINFTVIGSLCIAAGRSAQWLMKNPGLVRLQRRIVSVLSLVWRLGRLCPKPPRKQFSAANDRFLGPPERYVSGHFCGAVDVRVEPKPAVILLFS